MLRNRAPEPSGWKRLVGTGAFLALSLLAVGGALAPEWTGGSDEESIFMMGVKASELPDGAPIVVVRAQNTTGGLELDHYDVAIRLERVPCAGPLYYEAAGEDVSTGDSTSYEAVVLLRGFESIPDGDVCGRPLPRHLGARGVVRITGPFGELLRITAFRTGPSVFEGLLDLKGIPSCSGRHRLAVSIGTDGNRRIYRYGVSLSRFSSREQGSERKDVNCE